MQEGSENNDFFTVESLESVCLALKFIRCELGINRSIDQGFSQQIKVPTGSSLHGSAEVTPHGRGSLIVSNSPIFSATELLSYRFPRLCGLSRLI